MGQVIIAFTTKVLKEKATPDAAATEILVTSNLILNLPDDVIDYFNIPKPAAEIPTSSSRTIEGFTYKRYNGIGDDVGTDVVVPSYDRGSNSGANRGGKNIVVIPTEKKTAKKHTRKVSFRFPSFFNVIMIDQAVGSMIKAHEPKTYTLRGLMRTFVANSSTGIIAPAISGAWAATALITPVNVDDTGVVGPTVELSGGRQPKAAATPTP